MKKSSKRQIDLMICLCMFELINLKKNLFIANFKPIDVFSTKTFFPVFHIKKSTTMTNN